MVISSLTSCLPMTFSSSPRLKTLNLDTSLLFFMLLARLQVWRLILLSLRLFTQRVSLVQRSTASLLSPTFGVPPHRTSTLDSPYSKVEQLKVILTLSSKRCKLGWLLGNTVFLINLAGRLLLLQFCLPYLLTTCKSLGSLWIYVTSSIERPVISFGRMLTTKVSTWLVGITFLDLRFGAALALEWRETLISLFLVNLFGICFRGQINIGSASYLTSTPLAPRFSITPLLHPAQSLGTPLSKQKIFSRMVSLGGLARVSPLFGIVIGPPLDPFVLMTWPKQSVKFMLLPLQISTCFILFFLQISWTKSLTSICISTPTQNILSFAMKIPMESIQPMLAFLGSWNNGAGMPLPYPGHGFVVFIFQKK